MVDDHTRECLFDGIGCCWKFVERYAHVYVMRHVDKDVVPNKVEDSRYSKDGGALHLSAKFCPFFTRVPLDVFANVVNVDGEADD